MSESPILLSQSGERRREAILDLALVAARGRRRRRIALRASLAAILILVLLSPILRSLRPRDAHTVVHHTEPLPPRVPPSPVVERIETDPHIIERLAIPPTHAKVIIINDTELLGDLAMADRPAGLAYINGKAQLVFR